MQITNCTHAISLLSHVTDLTVASADEGDRLFDQYTPPTPTPLNCRAESRRRLWCEQNLQLAHDDCRQIRSTISKMTKQIPQRY